MVYVLIAGTYTPFCLIAFQGAWRWGLLTLIWAFALFGSLLKLRMMNAPVWLSTGIYIAMGWLAVLATPAFFATVPLAGILWVIAGGVVYTIGAVIFAIERPTFATRRLWGARPLACAGYRRECLSRLGCRAVSHAIGLSIAYGDVDQSARWDNRTGAIAGILLL